MGPRPGEQYRADRPRDRRGRRRGRGPVPGGRGGAKGRLREGCVTWPTYDKPPAVAFIDVDGTLLAETTTFLFARILRRKGLIKRSFVLRALYHGLQHRFGRLDYGRL